MKQDIPQSIRFPILYDGVFLSLNLALNIPETEFTIVAIVVDGRNDNWLPGYSPAASLP